MNFNYLKPGVGNAASYQVAGIPWYTSSVAPALSTTSTVVNLPQVTKFVTIKNKSTTDDSLRITFNNESVVDNDNYFLLEAGESFSADFRVTDIHLISDNETPVPFTIVNGLTNIQRQEMTQTTPTAPNLLAWIQKQKIYHTDENPDGDRPGFGLPGLAATEDNSILAVAAYRDESITGAAFIFKNINGVFQQTQKLTGSGDGDPVGDRFGQGISISSDGNVLAIGANNDDENGNNAGAVYIFKEINSLYEEVQRITASDQNVGTNVPRFGESIEVSRDGKKMLISSAYESGAVDSDGVVRIYESGSSGFQQAQRLTSSVPAYGHQFGYRTAITDDKEKIVILQRGVGASYVFVYNSESGGYEEVQALSIPDVGPTSLGPDSLSINSDASVIAIGKTISTNNSGSAYVFESGSSGYALTQTLTQSSDGDPAGDRFGYRVALNKEGSSLFISAWGDEENDGTNAGTVYLFENSGTGFQEVQKILADDPVSPEGDRFGYGLELSGDHLYVAASYDEVSGSISGEQGSVYAFKYTRDY